MTRMRGLARRGWVQGMSTGRGRVELILGCVLCLVASGISGATAAELADTIDRIKPSVVGIGTYQQTRSPRANLLGTGFVVGDGRHVVTNDHVLPETLEAEHLEFLAVVVPRPRGREGEVRRAARVAVDAARDLVLLRIEGEPLEPLALGNPGDVREGQAIAFTGFPIGALLGLVPATHRGTISAVTPIALPMRSSREIDSTMVRRLRNAFDIYQLDATAYPGNSGSPLYDPRTGEVLGVVNMVFVKEGRESALDRPSGISYAIPVRYVRDLLEQARAQGH
jgi:serine protease Do